MVSPLEKRPFEQVIKGPRIELVRADGSLTSLLWKSIQQDRKLRGGCWSWLESETHLKEYLSEHATDLPKDEFVYLLKHQNEVVGTLHIHSFNYSDYKTEIGYWICKSFEGKGFISESVKLVEAELKRLGFNKVIISCDVQNLRSVNLAERNGYSREGTLIQDCIENGKFRDSAIFGKILKA